MRMTWMAAMATTALVAGSAMAQQVDILSGGVGAGDRAMIEAQQNNYALKLVFSGQGGAYLAGVNVEMKDSKGATVLSTVTDGPILLVKLPAGTYMLTATASGIVKTQKVTVGHSLRTLQLNYPIHDDPELTDEQGTYLPKAASSMDGAYTPLNSAQ